MQKKINFSQEWYFFPKIKLIPELLVCYEAKFQKINLILEKFANFCNHFLFSLQKLAYLLFYLIL